MLKFIVVRLLSAIPVLIGISLVSFIIIQLPPGDFASSFKTNLLNNGVSEEEAERQVQAVRDAVWPRPAGPGPVRALDGQYYHQGPVRLLVRLQARCRRADRRAAAAHAGAGAGGARDLDDCRHLARHLRRHPPV